MTECPGDSCECLTSGGPSTRYSGATQIPQALRECVSRAPSRSHFSPSSTKNQRACLHGKTGSPFERDRDARVEDGLPVFPGREVVPRNRPADKPRRREALRRRQPTSSKYSLPGAPKKRFIADFRGTPPGS